MSRTLALLVALFGASGCLTRDVVLEIHTPAQCCATPGCVEPACPLAALRSVETTLEAVDGTVLFRGCERTPEGLCTFEELEGHVFLERVMQPANAVEVRVDAWTSEDCAGTLTLSCDSFGAHVVDLAHDEEIALFCGCPRVSAP